MPRPDKVEAVKEIASDLKSCDVYYFVDYRGLTYAESAQLRERLGKVDASLKVVKNTLAKIAAREAGVEGLEELLTRSHRHCLRQGRSGEDGQGGPGLHP